MNEGTLRILVAADAGSFHTERYVEGLTKCGCEVLLVSLESATSGMAAYKRLPSPTPIRALNYMLAANQLSTIAGKFKPDIINAHFATSYGFSVSKAFQKSSIPIVLHLWGSDILVAPHRSFWHRYKVRRALKTASCVVGDSQYLLDAAQRLYHHPHTKVIGWGIEQDCLALHKQNYEPSKPLKIIVPRAHESVYNNLFCVEALADLVRDGRVQLTFPSFGTQFKRFHQQVQVLVGDKISFYDKMERRDFLRFMASHDVYLSSSTSDSSPVSLIEAMALGLIPVAADIPGVREWLSSENGYLFPENEHATLSRIVSGIIDSSDDHTAIRQANFERVKIDGLFEQNISNTIELMNELIQRKGMAT